MCDSYKYSLKVYSDWPVHGTIMWTNRREEFFHMGGQFGEERAFPYAPIHSLTFNVPMQLTVHYLDGNLVDYNPDRGHGRYYGPDVLYNSYMVEASAAFSMGGYHREKTIDCSGRITSTGVNIITAPGHY